MFHTKNLNDKQKELLLVFKKLKALKEREILYILKDLTFRQMQESYERRYGGDGLQRDGKLEIVSNATICINVSRDVGHSSVQEEYQD